MDKLWYLREGVGHESKESLRRYYVEDYDFEKYDSSAQLGLGTALLLIMKTAPLLKQRPASIDDYKNELKGVFKKNIDTQKLFDEYLWPMYESQYDENDVNDERWNEYKNQLQNIYSYILLCVENPDFFNSMNLLLLSSRMVKNFSQPILRNDSVRYATEVYNTSDLEDLFLNTDRQELKYMYDCPLLCHICFATINELSSSGFTIKECDVCSEWFIEFSKNSKYCSDECQQAARKEKDSVRLSKDLEKTILSRRQVIRKRCEAKASAEDSEDADMTELHEFNEEVKKWRKVIDEDKTKIGDFKAWLDSLKKYRRKANK